jgi:hypothetical protein
MLTKALREAADEERRKAESVGERELVQYYEGNAKRLEKELARIGTND